MRITSLQWTAGGLSATLGALMLVVPYPFSSAAYAALSPHLTWCGPAFVLAGSVLFAAATLAPRFRVPFVVHLWGAGLLLALGVAFAMNGSWSAASNYPILASGMVIAPLLARQRTLPAWLGSHFFTLLVGFGAVVSGLLVLLRPDQYSAAAYDLTRPYLAWYGLALFGSGLLVCVRRTRIVQPHGGEIWAEGRSTTVRPSLFTLASPRIAAYDKHAQSPFRRAGRTSNEHSRSTHQCAA